MTAAPNENHVGIVVEGPGDRNALPIILRRYLNEQGVFHDVIGKPVVTNGYSNASKPDGIERFAAVAASRPGCRALVVLFDSDDECPVFRSGLLAERINSVTALPFAICLAERNYEDWLFASAETLALPELEYSSQSSGLKQIKKAMDRAYVKPVWQPRLTERMDYALARSRSASFDRFLDRFGDLVLHCF